MILLLLVILVITMIIAVVAVSAIYKQKHKPQTTDTSNPDYEMIICRDIAEIFCNTISCLNELCEINCHVIEASEKLISSIALTNRIETHQLKTLEDEIAFRQREVKELSTALPSFNFHSTRESKCILAKHNLSAIEIASAKTCVTQSINDILSNFEYLKEQLKNNQNNFLGLHLGLANLKSFHFECNALYYGALEGICSFPTEALNIYYALAPQWNNMPKGITLRSFNKEGFKMCQETEFHKSQQCIEKAEELVDQYSHDVDNLIKGLKRHEVNFFIAGSKSLQRERDVFAGVINLLQSQWKPLGFDVNSFSYQNFPKDITIDGHQQQYNNFIANHVNVAVFILSGKAGEYTMEEFEVAYINYKKNNAPIIFVYSLNDGTNKCDSIIHAKMEQEKQYWIEYKDTDQLRLLLERDLNSYLLGEYSKLTALMG